MNPWSFVAPIFIATCPLLGVFIYNLLELKSFKTEVRNEIKDFKREVKEEFSKVREDIKQINVELSNIKERLATLEERGRVRLN